MPVLNSASADEQEDNTEVVTDSETATVIEGIFYLLKLKYISFNEVCKTCLFTLVLYTINNAIIDHEKASFAYSV